jgi:hypothetical protein
MFRLILLLLCWIPLFGVDCDIAVVGTSPVSLFQALYHHFSGKKVIVFEQAPECGGAWKAIEMCGVPHADLGCHQIGSDSQLRTFLETYAGCRFVSMNDPLNPKQTGEYYFSQGCFELIDHLVQLIRRNNIPLYLNTRIEKTQIDPSERQIWLQSENQTWSAKQICCTPAAAFTLAETSQGAPHEITYYHLYLLIADPEPPRFSYTHAGKFGISRIMNLTHFAGLSHTGQQLIVFQVNGLDKLNNEHLFLEELKHKNQLSPAAYILRSESHIYKQAHSTYAEINRLPQQHKSFFEILNTSSFSSLSQYIPKWKTTLPIYESAR